MGTKANQATSIPVFRTSMYFFKEIKRTLANAFKTMNQDIQVPFHTLDSQESFNELMKRSEQEPVILFKHSLTCGISAMAHRRLAQLHEADDPPIYKLEVQNSRSLSNEVASHFDIVHESPQVILVFKGSPVYNTSHSGITPDSIREATATALIS